MSIATQTAQILAHLKSGKTITQKEAYEDFQCFRLSGRIYDLKQDGHAIEKRMIPTPSGKHVAEYFLA